MNLSVVLQRIKRRTNHQLWCGSHQFHWFKQALKCIKVWWGFVLKKILEDIKSFLWDHWYSSFEFLVISVLGFKAKVDCCLHTSWPACNGFLRFTSSATPADLLTASTSAEPFLPHVLLEVLVFKTGHCYEVANRDKRLDNYVHGNRNEMLRPPLMNLLDLL